MSKKISNLSNTSALFVFENNALNRAIISILKATLNKARYTLSVRGRHSDRVKVFKKHKIRPNYCNDVPLRYSERLAIYINKKGDKQ